MAQKRRRNDFLLRRWRKNAVETIFCCADDAKTPSKRFSAAQMAQKRRQNDFCCADDAKTPSKRRQLRKCNKNAVEMVSAAQMAQKRHRKHVSELKKPK
ncbi:MAG: hypothetical protein LBG18_08370 [Mediterranea sp.]|nr:hypothetical protein [Mediterranea sp.]